MNDLLEKYNDYMRLNGCRAEYILVNGIKIEFFYKEENFIHLLGLHKLKDIQMIQLFNDKKNRVVQTQYVISRIKQEKFTDTMVRASGFFHQSSANYITGQKVIRVSGFTLYNPENQIIVRDYF